VLPESASRGQPSGLCNPDPIKHAAVLGPIKTKPCGGRARRGQAWPPLRAAAARAAVGTEERRRRGSR